MSREAVFPNEVLLNIVSNLTSDADRSTLSALSRTSKATHDLILPLLYVNVIARRPSHLGAIIKNFLTEEASGEQEAASRKPSLGGITQPSELQGPERGLQILGMVRVVTLHSLPQVVDSANGPYPSGWHALKALCTASPPTGTPTRWNSLTLAGEALNQLQLVSTSISRPRTATCLPLEALLLFGRPRHIRIIYPYTGQTWPFPAFSTPPVPLHCMRPHEVILATTLRVAKGHNTTLCVHNVLDQQIPVSHIGAHHHISFIQFPSVSRQLRHGRRDFNPLPNVLIEERFKQISDMLHKSNPCFELDPSGHRVDPDAEPAFATWDESKDATWTIYRVGAMIAEIVNPLDDEPAVGRRIEAWYRGWVGTRYSVDKGHPEGFADELLARITFVHGDEGGQTECQACQHPVWLD